MAPVPGGHGCNEGCALALLGLAPGRAVERRDSPRRLFVILDRLDPEARRLRLARMGGMADIDTHEQAPLSLHSPVYPPAVALFQGAGICA